MAEIDARPTLLLRTLENPERFCVFGAVAHAAFGAENFEEPGVCFTRGEAFRFEAHGNFIVSDFHFGVENGVVPRVARGHPPFAVGTFRVNFLQLRIDTNWIPGETKWNVNRVHAEVAHDADFA